ncbi:hypothetical protein R6Q59_024456 [Mikania micrantha]
MLSVQKLMLKFTRTCSLRSVKIFRTISKNRNRNKSNSRSKKFSTNNYKPLRGDHHHHHEPPTKRFEYLKRRTTNDPKIITPETQPTDKRFGEKIEPKLTKKASDHKNDVDESIEFYVKTTSEPILSHDHYDAEFVDIVFGVNSLQVTKNTIPVSNNQDFSDLNKKKNANSNGSKIVLEKKQSLKKKNRTSMWHMIHQHMVSGLAAESEDIIVQKILMMLLVKKLRSERCWRLYHNKIHQRKVKCKVFTHSDAFKHVQEAVNEILLPDVIEPNVQ